MEITFFGEIKDKHVLSYCIPRLRFIFIAINLTEDVLLNYYTDIERKPLDRLMNQADKVEDNLEKWLEDNKYESYFDIQESRILSKLLNHYDTYVVISSHSKIYR
jgi:hypothetical protein